MTSSFRCAPLLLLVSACGSVTDPGLGSQAVPPVECPPQSPEPWACAAYEWQGEVYDCTLLDRCTEESFSYRLACCECDAELCNPDPTCGGGESSIPHCEHCTPVEGGSCVETTGTPVPVVFGGTGAQYTGRGQVVGVDVPDPVVGATPLSVEGCAEMPHNVHLVDADGEIWVFGFDLPEGPIPPRAFVVGEWLSLRSVLWEPFTALAVYDADDDLAFLHEQGLGHDLVERGFEAETGGSCTNIGNEPHCGPLVTDATILRPGQMAVIDVPVPTLITYLNADDQAWMAWPLP